MTKRDMMNRYYDERELHSAELSLKNGIENGTIKFNGEEISGDTYAARLAIKNYFKATWNKEHKAWTVNSDLAFAQTIFEKGLVVY